MNDSIAKTLKAERVTRARAELQIALAYVEEAAAQHDEKDAAGCMDLAESATLRALKAISGKSYLSMSGPIPR